MSLSKVQSSDLQGMQIELETGVMAKQANGSVVVRCGDCVLLATAVMAKKDNPKASFFPLTVEFVEKMYAAGKIPGGFFKREARPSTEATLISRLIDRPIRPTFNDDFNREVQLIVTLLSYDPNVSYDFLGIIAASAALTVSDIPFNGPVGAALVIYKEGEYLLNPNQEQQVDAELRMVLSGTKDAILMIESEASEVSEDIILEAVEKGHAYIKETVALQEQLAASASKEKTVYEAFSYDETLFSEIETFVGDQIQSNLRSGDKHATETFLGQLEEDIVSRFAQEDDEDRIFEVKFIFSKVKKAKIRQSILQEKCRPDGRGFSDIRPISIDVGMLPSVHGCALFTRGETQSLGVLTLGTTMDSQILDGPDDQENSRYFFHYNFPPYSVGELGFLRTGRRELGHGALAEKALKAVLPDLSEFDYTVRLVSEILESNGSSSMASVCSGSLALLHGGVQIKSPVSGIAMGLLMDGSDYVVLSDIQGLEDHYGDMDFKVAGTVEGITALQLDIKIAGLSMDILRTALAQAKEGRLYILDKMNAVLDQPNTKLSKTAPKVDTVHIHPDKVGLVIGQGGKTIKGIEKDSQATVFISDSEKGKVVISSRDQDSIDKAKAMILAFTKDAVVGDEYDGTVVKTTSFGAFVEILPGKQGLIHISKLSKERVNRVEDVVTVGQSLRVKINEIDRQHRINLLPVSLD
ncbi:MAG: polyribonucleotide nucleotidyltransferase [bacterium]